MNPARYASFQRLDLVYGQIDWEWTDTGLTAMDDDFTQVVTPPPAAPCEPTTGSDVRQFVTMTPLDGTPIPGDATLAGEEGAIAAFGVCHTYHLPFVAGQATGYRQNSPVTLVKRMDSASGSLLQALIYNQTYPEVSIRYYRGDPAGAAPQERFFEITLQDARVLGISQLVHEGVRYERIDLFYDEVTWESHPDGASTTDSWAMSPF